MPLDVDSNFVMDVVALLLIALVACLVVRLRHPAVARALHPCGTHRSGNEVCVTRACRHGKTASSQHGTLGLKELECAGCTPLLFMVVDKCYVLDEWTRTKTKSSLWDAYGLPDERRHRRADGSSARCSDLLDPFIHRIEVKNRRRHDYPGAVDPVRAISNHTS